MLHNFILCVFSFEIAVSKLGSFEKSLSENLIENGKKCRFLTVPFDYTTKPNFKCKDSFDAEFNVLQFL